MSHGISEYLRERYESCDETIAVARLLIGFTMVDGDIVPIPYLSTESTLLQLTSETFLIHGDMAKYHEDEMYVLKDLSPQPLWRMAVAGKGKVEGANYSLHVEHGFRLAVGQLERKLAVKDARQSVIGALDSLATRLTSPCTMIITTRRSFI